MGSGVVEKFRHQFRNLYAEFSVVLEVVRSSPDTSLDDTSAACTRLLTAYRRCLENVRSHRIEGRYSPKVTQDLLEMDKYETARLEQLEAAWQTATEENQRIKLLESSLERRHKRRTVNASQMLKNAKLQMEAELLRMEKIDAGLGEISGNIDRSNSLSDRYNAELRKAHMFFKQVLAKAETDKRYLNWSWTFLMLVCTYILLKRLNVLRLGVLVSSAQIDVQIQSTPQGIRIVLWVSRLCKDLLVKGYILLVPFDASTEQLTG
eukprot:Blabericola_migrator_1__12983@NODE_862_length_6235_cov_1175_870947_g611_i0_p4_GENE_NODE_862_length_6235_cov_1175_870947_g611_i0NODE_862_length_6235_cov_1175_870947_g611_i0_p4_ORF_typecomplete_len264_score49_63Sec20/PF03908_13/3_8e02Sec20/PF03908_13/1e06Phi29_GP16_7/PF06720_11/0_07AAA_13/PF13166_6/0_11TRCF/PF03461_15/0_32Exonuc_VII_L/PF02601_15/0_36HeLo/PF14479_6/7_7HeLo/PF14479_6/8_4ABC_tran_Xtn/PF12848_7/0_9_NODE_862_length_6235_cov_1175_870947_g611_i031383929